MAIVRKILNQPEPAKVPRKKLLVDLQEPEAPAVGGWSYKRREPPPGAPAAMDALGIVGKNRFVASPQQRDFFAYVEAGKGSCVLEAVAGAGKTTTLVRALGLMGGSVFLGAYNKKIADEIRAKAMELGVIRPGIFISTMHSAGMSTWKRSAEPNMIVDDGKTTAIVEGLIFDDKPRYEVLLRILPFVNRVVSFGKQYLIGVHSEVRREAPWRQLIEHFGADEDLTEDLSLERILPLIWDVYETSHARCRKTIDFDDMIYAPIAHGCKFYANNWVLVDEAQDLNPARQELARRMLAPNGRLIACGDSRQAIYGFTGAGADSLDRIAEAHQAVRLPLTVSYRCPRDVVAYANRWVTHIQAAPTAPKGVVAPVQFNPKLLDAKKALIPWYLQEEPPVDSAILCRYTKPLIKTAYGMLRAGKPCKIEGRDVGKGLIALARRWRITNLRTLEGRLDAHMQREVAKARAAKQSRREQEVVDRVETLKVIIERCHALGESTIEALVKQIELLFADNVKGVVVLSTGHKAKGREWDRVYWLESTKNAAKRPWEFVQEDNVKYVIATRAKAELFLVSEAVQGATADAGLL